MRFACVQFGFPQLNRKCGEKSSAAKQTLAGNKGHYAGWTLSFCLTRQFKVLILSISVLQPNLSPFESWNVLMTMINYSDTLCSVLV